MRRPQLRSVVITLGAFAIGLFVALLVRRESMVPLSPEALSNARAQWLEQRPVGYAATYELNGQQYEVHVRGPVVEEVVVDGTRPNAADWSTYSIDGLFDLLELELENLSDDAGPFGMQRRAVVARVRFDPAIGYPTSYLRSGGGVPPASVRVLEFHPNGRD